MSINIYLMDGPHHVYWADTTNNLVEMADAAGIYMHIWRPDEIGLTKAHQLIEPLQAGLAHLIGKPAHFKTFNARNGWGTYDDFVSFVSKYLDACVAHPDADVWVTK